MFISSTIEEIIFMGSQNFLRMCVSNIDELSPNHHACPKISPRLFFVVLFAWCWDKSAFTNCWGYGRLSISFTDQTETVAQLVRKCTPFLLLLTTTSICYLICCVLKYLLCLCMSKINKVIHCHGRAYHCQITHLFVLDYCFHNKLSCLDNRSSEGWGSTLHRSIVGLLIYNVSN
jgi:hypothetical protein